MINLNANCNSFPNFILRGSLPTCITALKSLSSNIHKFLTIKFALTVSNILASDIQLNNCKLR